MDVQPPTSRLPPIRQIQSCNPDDLTAALSYLRHIYNPEVRGSHRSRPGTKAHLSEHSTTSQFHMRTALDNLRSDAFERSYAIRWLTALVAQAGRWNEEAHVSELSAHPAVSDKENVIQNAASLLATCSGTAAAGVIVRDFVFEHATQEGQVLTVHVKDIPLDNRDYGSLGAQTWGGACVLAETIFDDPAGFGLVPDHIGGMRILELGAGTGLVSLILGKILESQVPLGKSVTIVATDYYPSVLENLRSNIEVNFPSSADREGDMLVNITSQALDWSSFPDANTDGSPLDLPFDLILGADIIYEVQHAIWIKSCLERLLHHPSRDLVPLFHLMIPLRPTHSLESSTIDTVFAGSASDPTSREAELRVVHKEIIPCDTDSVLGSDQIDYAYYKIGWC